MSLLEYFGSHTSLYAVRLVIALVLCGLIGFEREIKNQSAGFRTHILVGVGACLMMLLSLYGFESYIDEYDNVRFDPARIPSYVISGIGFLGAGTIMVHGVTIRGLTTAASIWTVAGIGLVVGAGMYDIALLSTAIVLLSLMFLNKIEKRKMKDSGKQRVEIIVAYKDSIQNVLSTLDQPGIVLRSSQMKKGEPIHTMRFVIEVKRKVQVNELVEKICNQDSVQEVKCSF
ncbi:MgtC/SapB family protein [Halobacillus locisalis]|uniref:MgtC/SapB family protein n=1 Tax=Halobacillus locisalis TaxID=220753 RepID=A0A838CYB9_9BACI|nr:MgtC/SapB family protein [Halobacillus locisalis]MBA2176894.1 MgtC/SapB family protein [Halobacillus locisalis]